MAFAEAVPPVEVGAPSPPSPGELRFPVLESRAPVDDELRLPGSRPSVGETVPKGSVAFDDRLPTEVGLVKSVPSESVGRESDADVGKPAPVGRTSEAGKVLEDVAFELPLPDPALFC